MGMIYIRKKCEAEGAREVLSQYNNDPDSLLAELCEHVPAYARFKSHQ